MRSRAPRRSKRQFQQALRAKRDVFQHGHVVGKREMLVHHADAGLDRGTRVAGRQRLAEGLDGALVGDIVAEEDVHQRGLAGAVLAKQGDDLAALEFEGNGVVCDKRAETLGDAGEAKDGRRARVRLSWQDGTEGRRVERVAASMKRPLLPVDGRRWPEGPDEGSAISEAAAAPHLPAGILSPQAGRGNPSSTSARRR